jgi:hypothetical protein
MSKRKSPKRETSLMIRPASLPEATRLLIQVATPQEFIKQRPGKGNKTFTYVEGGYVVARLNQIFSPVGWNFEVVKEQIEPNEVVVRGRLTIKDHKNGYSIAKDQYGTKERNAGVPLGDTLKAAATDCLKKCASLFGIALDVYWPQLDEDKLPAGVVKGVKAKGEAMPGKGQKMNKTQVLNMLVAKIKAEKDQTILSQYFEKINSNPNFSQDEKAKLIKAIAEQRKNNVNQNSQNKLL